MSANNVNWQLVFQLVSALRHLGHDCELFERTAQELFEEMQKFGWRPMAECPTGEHVLVNFTHPDTQRPVVTEVTKMMQWVYSPSLGIDVPLDDCHGWMPLPEPPPTTNHKQK